MSASRNVRRMFTLLVGLIALVWMADTTANAQTNYPVSTQFVETSLLNIGYEVQGPEYSTWVSKLKRGNT